MNFIQVSVTNVLSVIFVCDSQSKLLHNIGDLMHYIQIVEQGMHVSCIMILCR